MPKLRTDGGRASDSPSRTLEGTFDLEELRRRNNVALGMDLLYLVTTGFFAVMAAKSWGIYQLYVLDVPVMVPHPGWPAAIAALPLATLLYFGWSSSKPFFVAQLLAIALAVAADVVGLLPL